MKIKIKKRQAVDPKPSKPGLRCNNSVTISR